MEQLAAHVHESLDGNSFIIYTRNGDNDFGGVYDAVHGEPTTGSAGGSQPHTHALDGSTNNGNSLPPFYSLSYIMRIS